MTPTSVPTDPISRITKTLPETSESNQPIKRPSAIPVTMNLNTVRTFFISRVLPPGWVLTADSRQPLLLSSSPGDQSPIKLSRASHVGRRISRQVLAVRSGHRLRISPRLSHDPMELCANPVMCGKVRGSARGSGDRQRRPCDAMGSQLWRMARRILGIPPAWSGGRSNGSRRCTRICCASV